MKKLNRYLNNIFFQSKAPDLFEQVYKDINTSKSYRDYCKEVHSLDLPCWNTLSKNQLDFLEGKISELRPKLVLDIGSGNGQLTKYLATKYNFEATGIDFAQLPVKSKNAQFIKGSFIENKLLSSYDTIISIDSFYMINNYKKYLKKLLTHLTPSGQVIILFTYTHGSFEESKVRKALKSMKLDFTIKDFTEDDYKFWKKSTELLDKFNDAFVEEGHFKLWNIKQKEVNKNITLHQSNSTKRLALTIQRG